jgi:hypothetical protein
MTDNMETKTESVNDIVDENETKPSHKIDGKYAILMETNGEEYESWYYFIRYEGNEESLKHLDNQLNKVDWEIIEDLSTFDLELEYLVSAQTAKEMTKIDLNAYSFHRKFDGKLKKIDFDFKKKDGNETKICKVFDMLSFGQIDEYISDEDIDEEDLTSSSSTDDESYSESESSEEDDSPPRKNKKIPPSLLREKLVNKIKEEQSKRKKGTKQEKINYDE